MHYEVVYNQGMFQVIDTEKNTVRCEYKSIEAAGSVCHDLNIKNSGLLVLDDGQVRPINSLELEMLAIIRSMSSKLKDAAELWEEYVKNFPEPAEQYRIYAEFNTYLKQFGF
jgi:hypothetical protein